MTQDDTRSTFGFKWSKFPVDKRDDDSRPGLAYGPDRLRRYGWSVEGFESWVDGKTVLDAGCGVGWYTDFLAERNSTGETYGIDLAPEAVGKGRDLGYRNLLAGDIGALPFRDDTFDYVACEEVLHHTPEPQSYLDGLLDVLRPGGTLSLYVYKEKPLLRETADEILRERTTEMDIEECMDVAERLTTLGQELYEIDEEITVPDIPLLDIEAGTYSVHEFIYRHFLKCYFDWETEDRDTSVATNFDWYHPEYAHRYDEDGLKSMIESAGLEVRNFEELMSGFAVRAVLKS